jgi:hypothetical protein
MNPEVITQSVNPRAITTFFNAISSITKFEENLPIIQMIGEGSAGVDVSTMFTMFINNKMDQIISPSDIINNPNESYVVGALNTAIGSGDSFRADISSVVATRIINYCLIHAETKPVTDQMVNRVIKLVTDCDAFTDDLRYYIVKEIVNGNKQKWQKLMMNSTVVKMTVK